MANHVIDVSRLQEMSGGDRDFEQEILGMYFEDCVAILDQIDVQFSKGAFADMRRAAHAIKGSSANLGAVGVQQAAGHLEEVAESGHGPTVQEAVAKLRQVYDETVTKLKAYLSGASS